MKVTLAVIDRLTASRIGVFDVACPECGPDRRAPANRKREVLRVWHIERGFATYHCARCGLQGHARDGSLSPADPARLARVKGEMQARNRETATERLQLARFLWSRRQPPERSPVAPYLRQVRCYSGPIPPTIGYLPPRKPEHHPAMISAFGWPIGEPEPGTMVIPDEAVRGVHLTLLRPDGSGKADTDNQKFMIGRSIGFPIPLACMDDQLGLIVAEGIETGLSLHDATGMGVWAAGAASRMPALAEITPAYTDCITIAGEPDPDGRKHAAALAERLRAHGLHADVRFLATEEASA